MTPRGSTSVNPLQIAYKELAIAAKTDLQGAVTSSKLLELVKISLDFLANDCTSVDLISRVPGKKYSSYTTKTAPSALSRPTNVDLFVSDSAWVEKQWNVWPTRALPPQDASRLVYTMATAYSVASDLFDRNNKKGPATYFEHFVGHCFAHELGVNPSKRANFLIGGRHVSMTMDFIFDQGPGKAKLHLPVKLSTRERVVQAWAHQRMLDAAYGDGAYAALLIVHSETKLDSRNREVVEICVPDQWLAYQTLLAKMDRIYFFDMPGRYLTLAKDFPKIIAVANYAEFFTKKRIAI